LDLLKNKLYIFWKIGKIVFEKQEKCSNAFEKYANYYSYYFGNSYIFTRENLKYMEKFYLSFPIFYKQLKNISWEQYKLLLNIDYFEERFFYFRIILLFNSDYTSTKELLKNNYYYRI